MDRNIAKLFQTTLTFYNRRISCNTRNNANILTIQLRNNSTARFKVGEDKGTLLGLKAPQKPKPSFQTNALLLSVPIVTFCLGTWQVKRREWKLKLIDELENKTRQPAIDLPEDLSELENLTYRRVKLRGRFDHSLEMYLGPRTVLHDNSADSEGSGGLMSTDIRARTGYLVVTPFILADSGKRILVNRGWVNTKLVPKERRLEGQVEGEVEITGIVRDNEERGTFVGKNIKSIRIFHYRHLKTMAELGDTLPYYVDACVESSVEGGPLGGQTNLTLRNEHTSYIITWYSLSAITFVMWLRMVLK